MTSATRPPDIDGMIGSGQARRRRRNAARAGIAVLAVAAIGGGVYGVTQLGPDDDREPQVANQPSSSVEVSTGQRSLPSSGPVEPGTYEVAGTTPWSVADYRITVPEGWTMRDGRTLYWKYGEPGEITLDPVLVDEIYRDACAGDDHTDGVPIAVGPGTDALISALRNQKHGAAVSPPVETTVGGHPATRIDLTVPARMDVSSCRVPGALQIWAHRPDGYLAFVAGGTARLYILDVDGERQIFVTGRTEASVEDEAELYQMLDSIEFGS